MTGNQHERTRPRITQSVIARGNRFMSKRYWRSTVKTLRTVWPLIISMVVVLCLVAGASGCGKKEWPRPQLEQDRFHWAQIQHQRYDQCLDVRALLDGAALNLRFVILEWMELEGAEDCPGCLFSGTSRARLDDSSTGFKRQNGVIRMLFCGWEPGISCRWRLVGANKVKTSLLCQKRKTPRFSRNGEFYATSSKMPCRAPGFCYNKGKYLLSSYSVTWMR